MNCSTKNKMKCKLKFNCKILIAGLHIDQIGDTEYPSIPDMDIDVVTNKALIVLLRRKFESGTVYASKVKTNEQISYRIQMTSLRICVPHEHHNHL